MAQSVTRLYSMVADLSEKFGHTGGPRMGSPFGMAPPVSIATGGAGHEASSMSSLSDPSHRRANSLEQPPDAPRSQPAPRAATPLTAGAGGDSPTVHAGESTCDDRRGGEHASPQWSHEMCRETKRLQVDFTFLVEYLDTREAGQSSEGALSVDEVESLDPRGASRVLDGLRACRAEGVTVQELQELPWDNDRWGLIGQWLERERGPGTPTSGGDRLPTPPRTSSLGTSLSGAEVPEPMPERFLEEAPRELSTGRALWLSPQPTAAVRPVPVRPAPRQGDSAAGTRDHLVATTPADLMQRLKGHDFQAPTPRDPTELAQQGEWFTNNGEHLQRSDLRRPYCNGRTGELFVPTDVEPRWVPDISGLDYLSTEYARCGSRAY